jgi:hypothetical protein
LCLGFDRGYAAPQGLDESAAAAQSNHTSVRVEKGRTVNTTHKTTSRTKNRAQATKDWVLAKKEKRRNANKETRRDSKYTARKRKDKF